LGSSRASDILLLAIRPHYAEQILAGKKRVEFRRQRPRRRCSVALVYSCSPVKAVTGWFEVTGVVVASPDQLWARFSMIAGIDHRSFQEYFSFSESGCAICVGATHRLCQPLAIGEVLKTKLPPRSFRYLPASALPTLLARALSISHTSA
jgi:predicted transcriptional regulator